MTRPKAVPGLMVALLVLSGAARAAPPVVPGAGTIIHEAEPVTPPAPSSSGTGLSIESPQSQQPATGAPFAVKTLRITGNTVFEAATLHALVADAEGQELTLSRLHELTTRISDYYHAHGYPLARAIIPAQTVHDGLVSIEVIEARYDSVELDNHSRVRNGLLHATLAPLQSGQLIAQAPLDHVLLLLSDVPGALTTATLKPGDTVGTSALAVQSTAGPAITGDVALDNYGSRYTGNARFGGTVNLIDPLHLGDVLSASALTSGHGMNYGRLGYELLLDGAGLRAGAAYSGLHYELGDSLAALDGTGSAQVASVWARQPLMRTPTVNVYGQIQFDHKRLDDELGASDIRTDRHLNNWTASLAGDWRDAWLTGAVNSWTVAGSAGQVVFDNASAQLTDAATARTQGRFAKGSASVDRLQNLGPQDALNLALSAQWSSANLDESEKLVGGGPYSVRAYDVDALSGDVGYLGSLEYRHILAEAAGGQWQTVAFVDSEHLTANKSPWTAGAHSATFSGAGIGLNFTARARWYVKGFLAVPFGPTPELIGANKSARVWAELGWNF